MWFKKRFNLVFHKWDYNDSSIFSCKNPYYTHLLVQGIFYLFDLSKLLFKIKLILLTY